MVKHHKEVQILQRLVLVSLLLAIMVIGLGAYTRLTHAGLGCPDWPTCYGLINVPKTSEQIAAANLAFPTTPVEPDKAWNEMIHRYFAGSLGLLIVAIALFSIKLRFSKNTKINYPIFLPLFILLVVIFQAALGMWTVTLKLMPIVVMAHLLGGFTTLCLLFLLYLRIKAKGINAKGASLVDCQLKKYPRYALLGISILTAQIALGGWTAANYAAMSCVELPICQGDWLTQLTFKQSFDLIPPNKESYEFGHLAHSERVTIHVSHRLGAIITGLFIGWLAIIIFIKARNYSLKSAAVTVLTLLIIQISLGASNVWFSLPLKVAVAHNVVAACLLLSLIALTYKLRKNSEGAL